MIENSEILIFADDWGRYPSTLQHIGKILAERNRIIWIGSLGLRKPKFSFSDVRRIINKIIAMFKPVGGTIKNKVPVILCNPFVLPFHDSSIIRKINNILVPYQINRALRKHSFKNFRIITSHPVTADYVDRLNACSIHYVCLDDYTLFDNAFNSLTELEKLLLKKAHSVFCVSDRLIKTRIPESGKSFFLPQGVNINHFKNANKLTRNAVTIGFFGMIAEWINLELIIKAAARYPDFRFLIIGKNTVDIRIFDQYSNINYIGPVSFVELPSIAAQFTVGLLPFQVDDLTAAVNPLKLLEYFALGIPVVSSAMPEVKKFQPLVYVAESDEEFVYFIERAVKEDTATARNERIEMAERYSWESIVEDFCDQIIEAENFTK